MGSILEALKSTPIPTILVVAGIAFLLLSIAGQLAGRIVVPPERQRQAAIIGSFLLVIGVALHVAPLKFFEGPSVPPPPPDHQPPHPPPPPDPGSEIPTKYAGVMARITRFEISGAFITLEITVKNSGKDRLIVCGRARNAELSDQQTGDSWGPVNTGGDISVCERVNASGESGMWMQFKIPNPDKRVFLLKSDLFNRPIEKLVLGKPP